MTEKREQRRLLGLISEPITFGRALSSLNLKTYRKKTIIAIVSHFVFCKIQKIKTVYLFLLPTNKKTSYSLKKLT